MPNYVTNIIEIDGEQEIINQMFDNIKSDATLFDFEKIKKMPESEAKNWCDWRINNWGTKWNTVDVFRHFMYNTVKFDTAWSTPFDVLLELSKQYPTLGFIIKYADEDVGSNCGIYKLQNGNLLEDEKGDLVFACEILGLDPADFDDGYRRDKVIDLIIKDEN
jgi:hypothetical protein